VLFDQQEAIPEIGIPRLVRAEREVLSDKRLFDAHEMRALERRANGQVELRAPTESIVEAAKVSQGLRPGHEGATPEHAPGMVTVVLEETQDVIGDDRPGRGRRESADPEALRRGMHGTRFHDSPVRVAEDGCSRVHRLVLYD
jgi:hypothetical protein